MNIPFEEVEYHHTMPMQLRFIDGDQFGHVNNSIYFQYYDTAKFRYFQDVCPALTKGHAIVVVHIDADFLSQVHTTDEDEVQTAITKIGNKSFVFQQRLIDAKTHEVKCIGRTVMEPFDMEQNMAVPFKPEWRETIERFEGRCLSADC